jgi:hypothetical protein
VGSPVAWTPYYKPTFYRHLNHLVINGFYARDLDADDHAFIEGVKTRGIANGSLPNSSAVLIEELGFWHLPYAVAPGIERRVGRPPPIKETPEQRELRQARVSRWHAQRTIRKQEREIAAAELAREEREQAEAIRRRKVREIITDAEWDAAAPVEAPFGAVVDGKYVPEWKLEEQGIARPVQAKNGKSRTMTRSEVREAIELRRLANDVAARKRRQIEERALLRRSLIAAEEDERRRTQSASKKQERKAAKEQERREQVLAEARENLMRIALLEKQWTANPYPDRDSLKNAIIGLLNGTPGHAWSGQEMMRSLGCTDVNLMNEAIDDLVLTGRLKTGPR